MAKKVNKEEEVLKERDSKSDGAIEVGPQNANLNYYQYGDDSNPEQQGQLGGMNEKYTGEGVSTSNLEYNSEIKTADLDPNYKYGENARQQNRQEAGYIARRNDMIASALYNEGLTSKEDVAAYLSQQQDWENSTDADRANTIESVWKRIGQIRPVEEKPDLSVADSIAEDTSGKIYGKTTADDGEVMEGIDTLSDENSVYKIMDEARSSKLKEFVGIGYKTIATSIAEGVSGWSEQTWRDAQQYYPDFINQINAEVKKINAQKNANAIATGGDISSITDVGQSNINNSLVDFSLSTGGNSTDILDNINEDLNNSVTANSANEVMTSIEGEVAVLKNRLKNLRKEANTVFKGDAPDYLVRAYMNNKSQEIQNQLSILEDRYNAAYQRYTNEIAQSQWQQEFDLKKQQLELQKDAAALEKWATEQGIALDWAKLGLSQSSNTDNSGDEDNNGYVTTTLSNEQVSQAVDKLYDMFDNGQLGNAQCAAGIQKYYLPLLGISLPNLSSIENKRKLINEDEGYTPKRGDLIILSSKSSPTNGHIGVVLNVSENGYIEYMDWNGTLDANGEGTEKPAISGIDIANSKILGFRNVNKGQSDLSNKEWGDYDWVNFSNFLDSNNKDISNTDRESIAEMYGFKDNLPGMTEFAKEQLANRVEEVEEENYLNVPEGSTVTTNEQGRVVITPPEGDPIVYAYGVTADDPRLLEAGFDPVLGYNPKLRDVYEKIKSTDKVGFTTEQEKIYNRKEGQLGQELTNYELAKANGIDEYSDPTRKVSRDWGFAVDKKDVYNRLSSAIAVKKSLTDNEWEPFIKELGFSKSDPKAIEKASDELAKFEERQRSQLEDVEVYNLLNALEFIIMQNATKPQRWSIMAGNTDEKGNILYDDLWGEEADWATKYNYILATEVFEKLINTKGAGATLYPVSDADMAMIKAASTLINGNDSNYSFKKAINQKYKALRQYVGKPVSDEELDDMRGQEGRPLLGIGGDFTDYLTIDKARWSGLFGGFDYGHKGETIIDEEFNGIGDVDGGTTEGESYENLGDDILSEISNN